jgi:hypothetical protein
LSGPVGLPVGEPLVWNDGCGIGAAKAGCAISTASTIAAEVMSLDGISVAWNSPFNRGI